MAATFDEERMKDLLKSALVEALEEHRALVIDHMLLRGHSGVAIG